MWLLSAAAWAVRSSARNLLLSGHLLYFFADRLDRAVRRIDFQFFGDGRDHWLAFAIGSWVLNFTTAGSSGLAGWLHLSLTPALRTFENGLLSAGLVAGIVVAIAGFCTLAASLAARRHPRARRVPAIGSLRLRCRNSFGCCIEPSLDLNVTEISATGFPDGSTGMSSLKNRCRSQSSGPEDPRYVDLRRNVLAKLDASCRMPRFALREACSACAQAPTASDTGGFIAGDWHTVARRFRARSAAVTNSTMFGPS